METSNNISQTLHKYTIGETDRSIGIGFCMSDLESIDCDLSDLLNRTFKTTIFSRDIVGIDGKYTNYNKQIFYPSIPVQFYEKPKAFLSQQTWNKLTIEKLKTFKHYQEVEYMGHKVYIGLNLTEEDLIEMEDKKKYYTNHIYVGEGRRGLSHEPFEM